MSDILADGQYCVEASVTEIESERTASTESAAEVYAVSVKLNPLEDGFDQYPAISGTTSLADGTPITVVVTDANQNVQTLEAIANNGCFAVVVPVALADGQYSVQVSVTEPSSKRTSCSYTEAIVETLNVSLEEPEKSAEQYPILSGYSNASAGSVVTLKISDGSGDIQSLTTCVDEAGYFYIQVPQALNIGQYTVLATVVDLETQRQADSLTSSNIWVLPLVEVSIEPIALLKDPEITTSVKIKGSISGSAGSEPVKVEVKVAGKTYEAVIDEADNSWSVDVPAGHLRMDTQVEVIGIVKDIQSQLESLPSQPVIGTIPVEITSAQIVVGGDGDDDIVGGSSEDILVGDLGGVQTYTEAGKNYNIAMLIDLSGSMAGTIKYNGKNMTYAQMVQEVLKHFSSILAKHDGLINFKIMIFSSKDSWGFNYSGNRKSIEISAQSLKDPKKLAELESWISQKITATSGTFSSGGTDYNEAFKQATDWFNSANIKNSGYENQTYFITDGDPTDNVQNNKANFAKLDQLSKVFAAGILHPKEETLKLYDNTNEQGEKVAIGEGSVAVLKTPQELMAYIIGEQLVTQLNPMGHDNIHAGAGADVIFADTINTDHLTWDGRISPQGSGYIVIEEYLKSQKTVGEVLTQQEVYTFLKKHFRDFIKENDTHGGNDIIKAGSGDDIIIAGAGNDTIYADQGNDLISSGLGLDTLVYEVLDAADATAGHGVDTWIDFNLAGSGHDSNLLDVDVIQFDKEFFDSLLSDLSNINDYITVEDIDGHAVIRVDRDGSESEFQCTDLLILENQQGLTLQQLLSENQLIIG